MNTTATAEKPQDTKTAEPRPASPPVPFQPPRLPYHPAIEERFGIDKSGWNALVNAIYPSAKSVDSVCMVLSYCKARQLDPFKRPVHIVPMWDARRRAEVETVWPGIAEIRTTASRTGEYAGCDEAAFGPDETQTFKGSRKIKGNWEDAEVSVTFPQWCQITVYRMIGGHPRAFVGPKVYWQETYATTGKGDLPNDMWARRTRGQLEKCAEAAALRKAFPEELGNMLTAEEMHGQQLMADENTIEHIADEQRETEREAVKVVQAGAKKDLPPVAGEEKNAPEPPHDGGDAAPAPVESEDSAAGAADPGDIPEGLDRRKKPDIDRDGATDAETEGGSLLEYAKQPDKFLDELDARLDALNDGDADGLVSIREQAEAAMDWLMPPDREKAQALIDKTEKRFSG